MQNNILLRTTFKDHLDLLNPFYRFYKHIWNPETYIFYIGYNKYNEQKIIHDINELLNIKINYISDTETMHSYIKNSKIYKYKNLYFVLYETIKDSLSNIWHNMRNFLYRISNLPNIKNYKYYLNLDNDDFFYVKNVKQILNNNKVLRTHAVEFISHNKFSLKHDFEFISNNYYYRLKGALNRELTPKNSHLWCRALYLTEPYRNEEHVGKSENCNSYDELTNIEFSELDNVCFSFGCLDLNYLLHMKYWLQSSDTETARCKYSDNVIIEHFNKYYTLTDIERKNNIIVTCNELKEYFR